MEIVIQGIGILILIALLIKGSNYTAKTKVKVPKKIKLIHYKGKKKKKSIKPDKLYKFDNKEEKIFD